MIGGPIGWPIGGVIDDDVDISWFTPFREPVRRKVKRPAIYAFQSPAFLPVVVSTSWLYGQPTVPRRKRNNAPYQMFYTAPARVLPNVTITVTMDVTEAANDMAVFGISVYEQAIRAVVTIEEITPKGGVTSIREP